MCTVKPELFLWGGLAKYVSWVECHCEFCERYSVFALLCKRMLYRIAEKFCVTGSLFGWRGGGGGGENCKYQFHSRKIDDIGAELKDMPQNNIVPVGSSEWSVKLKLNTAIKLLKLWPYSVISGKPEADVVGAFKTISTKWLSLSGIDIFSDEGWFVFSGTVNFHAVHRVPLHDSQVIVLVSVSICKITEFCVLKK